jgi:hypothetical protein
MQHPSKRIEFPSKVRTIAAILTTGLPVVLSAGCAQPRPAVAQSPQITFNMTGTGDIPAPPIGANGQPFHSRPNHPAGKDHVYHFGPAAAAGSVCFWEDGTPQQRCWPNTDTASFRINPQGHIDQGPGTPGNHGATVQMDWFYGSGSWCLWSQIGIVWCDE